MDTGGGTTSSSSLLSANVPRKSLFAQQNWHDVPSARLNELSLDERSQGFYDLHGVNSGVAADFGSMSRSSNPQESNALPVIETPEFCEAKLEELDLNLRVIEQADAFLEASLQNPSYVQRIRMTFLRSEDYDAGKAALRMENTRGLPPGQA